MEIIYFILVFISGCFIGSFLNLVSDRIVKGESIVFGRSKCDFCGKFLNPKNLLPIVSFLMQRGKSACCKKKMSFYYPLSEVLTGGMFVLAAIYSDVFSTFELPRVLPFIYLLIVFSFFIIMTLSDLKYFIIPDKVVFMAIIFVFSVAVFSMLFDALTLYKALNADVFGKYLMQAGYFKNQMTWMLKESMILLVSSFGISLFFLFLIFITKGRGMGGGDVKLGLLIGLFNGFPGNVLAIFLGFVLGSVVSLFLVALRKKTVKDIIPFGPFLILGSIISYFWGPVILTWYYGLLR